MLFAFPLIASAQSADLSMSITTSATGYNIGLVMPYILTIKNNGTNTTTNVKAQIVLPAGLGVESANATPGTYSISTNIWNVGSISAGSTKTLLLSCTATTGGLKKVFAQVIASGLTDPDSSPNNNATTNPVEDDEFAWTAEALQVDMELSGTIAPGSSTAPALNENVTFSITIINKGASKGTNTKVRCILPNGMQHVSASVPIGEFLSQYRVWYIGDLVPNVPYTMTLTAKMVQQGTLVYEPEVRVCNQPDLDSEPSNYVTTEDDMAHITVNVGAATKRVDLALSMSANKSTYSGGDTLTYIFALNNNAGDTTASSVKIKAVLPAGDTYVSATGGTYSASTGIFTLPNILVGNTHTCTLRIIVNGTATHTFFAQVYTATPYDKDSSPNNNTSNVPNEDDEAKHVLTYVSPSTSIDLQLQLTSASPTYQIYTNVVFTATITNNSTTTATNVVVSLPYPPNFVYSSSSATLGTYNNYYYQWQIATLNPGQTASMTLAVFALAGGVPVHAFAQVQSANQIDVDSSPGNDTNQTADEDDEALCNVSPQVNMIGLNADNQAIGLQIAKIYPNPTIDMVELGIDSPTETPAEVQLFDAYGRMIQSSKLQLYEGGNTTTLDLSRLPMGIYYGIVSIAGHQIASQPIVKI